jgi:cell division protein YceG involved in septum cleavage
LYPDTYKINPISFKINNFVILQLNTFEEKVYNTLFIDEITKQQLYSTSIIESVVNLASIVEKEERNKSKQKTVAGILKKRLKEYRQL